ncbi:MAG: hypothetical protein CVV21_07505 [Candidatus Goldiibacteriota bacterium HGW-Goldbacteria-1]|nr:MAG: hypothetical protein CVV21_07505 [Candidatus Goldiibacteriota bacterium HGW-Goldbacteria-1]
MKRIILAVILTVFASALFGAKTSPVLTGHITTCSGLINNYPADTTNWFFRTQHQVVQYWAYLLFPAKHSSPGMKQRNHFFENPYAVYSGAGSQEVEDSNIFELRIISPTGKVIAEKVLNWDKNAAENKKVTVDSGEYLPYVVANYIGIKQMFPENGQGLLPDEIGLYHVDLYLNGRKIAMTFFEMKD